MKFSVVTISFNQAPYLRRAIDSVLCQGNNIEYIVVDPGSTDGSREIIESYGDAITHKVFEKDRGPADGLNMGFARATGDVYCYLNSDDSFEMDAFVRVAEFFSKSSTVDLVYGHAWIIGASDERLRRLWSNPVDRIRIAYGASEQVQPSTFFTAEIFRRTKGFNIENRSNWDAELLTDMLAAGARCQMIDAFLSNYRLHPESITTSGILEARIHDYWRRRFISLMAREPRWYDPLFGGYYRLEKHFRQPSAAWERLTKGPIFKRNLI